MIDFLNQNILAEKFSNVNYYNIFYFVSTYNIATIYIVLIITSNQISVDYMQIQYSIWMALDRCVVVLELFGYEK